MPHLIEYGVAISCPANASSSDITNTYTLFCNSVVPDFVSRCGLQGKQIAIHQGTNLNGEMVLSAYYSNIPSTRFDPGGPEAYLNTVVTTITG